MKTLNQHINIFRTFANNHLVINSFGWGDSWENNSSGNIYPQMFIEIVDSAVNGGILTDTYRIFFSDYVRHDEINEIFSLSEMKSCALDLVAYLDKSGVLGTTSDIDVSHTIEPYTEAWDDRVSGWVLNLSIIQTYIYDYCNIPLFGDVSSGSMCPDVIIYNSDGSINQRIPVGGSYTISSCSDATITDNLASPSTVSVSPGGSYTCTLISSATCAQLNHTTNGLTLSQRNQIQIVQDIKTGQTTSYATGDDGDLEKGRGVSFSILNCNNGFGNTNRFTDELGGQTYTNGLVVDWQSGVMWYRIPQAASNWNTAISGANASVQGGYSDWFVPNILQLISISNYGQTDSLNYSPFNIAAATYTQLWTSTTDATTTTNAYQCQPLRGQFAVLIKTNTVPYYLLARIFSLSDLGL